MSYDSNVRANMFATIPPSARPIAMAILLFAVSATPALANTAPSINAKNPVSLTAGTSGFSVKEIATVYDPDQESGLKVTAVQVPTNIYVNDIAVEAGRVNATVSAMCWVGVGEHTVTLQVEDSSGAKATAKVTIKVAANPEPTLGVYADQLITPGSSVEVTPSAPPSDNGDVRRLFVRVVSVDFSGSVSFNPSTGAVMIDNANSGSHTFQVYAVDNCDAQGTASFVVNVSTPPTITAAPAPSVRAGGTNPGVTIATVDDLEDGPLSLSVTVVDDEGSGSGEFPLPPTPGPSTFVLTNITNDGGTISADIEVPCRWVSEDGTTTTGENTITLRVTDRHGTSATTDVTFNVMPDTAPVLGFYYDTHTFPGEGVVVPPSAPPSDNWPLSYVYAFAKPDGTGPEFTGTIEIDPTTGAITIDNANEGLYTVRVGARDACDQTTQTQFVLHVGPMQTTTALVSNESSPQTYGRPLSLTATVTGFYGTPTGSVSFYNYAVLLGTVALDSSGRATLDRVLSAGTYKCTAVYAGDEKNASSTSSLVTAVIQPARTETSLGSRNPVSDTERFTLSAMVYSAFGTATGTVTFYQDNVAIGTSTVSRGFATLTRGPLPLGSYTYTAAYNGSRNFAASATEGAYTQYVQRRVSAAITTTSGTCAGSAGNTARVPTQTGVTYQWSINNGGTITAGQGTPQITFTAPTSDHSFVRVTAEVSCATCTTATGEKLIMVGERPASVPDDLDDDGRNDLLFRDSASGQHVLWSMNGTTRAGIANLGAADVEWTVVAQADFNYDEKADLILSNGAANQVWLLSGGSVIGTASLNVPSGQTQIGAAADFNCDNNPDLVVRNQTTGVNQIWLMDGYRQMDTVTTLPKLASSWKLEGTGDFDGDGYADIVYRDYATGTTSVWLMNGINRRSSAKITNELDTAWEIGAIADYDSDGKVDLGWHKPSSGETRIWTLNGFARKATITLPAATSMELVGPR